MKINIYLKKLAMACHIKLGRSMPFFILNMTVKKKNLKF